MQNSTRSFTLVALTGATLAGCVTNGPPTEEVWQRYVGKPVTALVVRAGQPSASFDTAKGRAFQWKLTAQADSGGVANRVGNVTFISPSVSETLTCIATFYAAKTGRGEGYDAWTVTSFEPARGNC